MSDLPLFQRFPTLEGRIPRIPLGVYPTPVERWSALGGRIGVGDLWVKRDDLTGPHFGGNKVRTLEFALAAGLESGRSLVVVAPLGSSWAAACAYYGWRVGAGIDLFLFRSPGPATPEPNAAITRAYGRSHVVRGGPLGLPLPIAVHWLRNRVHPPRMLPLGGSSPTSTLGYASAALELGAQVRSGEMPRPDVIVVPLGSGGTAAGLLVGISVLGWPTRIIAVRVTYSIPANRPHTVRLARRAARVVSRAGGGASFVRSDRLEVEGGFFGGRYGAVTPEGAEAARTVEETEGIALDPTYTAKSAAALLSRARQGEFRTETVLYWHTHNSRDPAPLLPGPGSAGTGEASPLIDPGRGSG